MMTASDGDAFPVAEPTKGAKLYLVASGVSQVAALLRYVTMARILGPTELGLAATLVVTGAFFDLITDTGADRFLIQDEHGDEARTQHLVQLLYVTRALLISGCIVASSGALAHFYRAPELKIGFMVLAASPLIMGFLNLDMRRKQRQRDFRIEALVMLCGEISSLVAIVAAALVVHDYTTILYGLIIRSLVMVTVSHLCAERRYALGYDREYGPRLLRYAAPLVVTGMMLFVGSQGDRVIVVNQLGVKELGLYSAVLMLVFYPTAALLRYMHALYVPQIAAARANPQDFRTVSERLGGQTFFLSIVTMAGFALFAPMVVGLLYGHRYEQAPLLIGLIGALQTTRILINWPTTVALATGRSGAVMLSNFFRILAFPGAFAGLWVIGGLTGLVAGFAAGEVTAIAAGIALLNRNTGRPPYAGFGRLSRHVIAAMLLVAWELVVARPDVWNVLTTAGATIGAVVWILWSDWTSIADLAKSCVVGITSLRPGRNRPGRPAAPAARTEGWVDAAAVNSTMNSARIAEEKAIVTGADR